MLNRYPLWKYLLILGVLVIGMIYALPNLYGTDPALQVSASTTTTVDSTTMSQVRNILEGKDIPIKAMVQDKDGLLVRFNDVEDQLKAQGIVSQVLGDDYTVAMNFASAAPSWLKDNFRALPMYLGLDLRGGLHFLMEIVELLCKLCIFLWERQYSPLQYFCYLNLFQKIKHANMVRLHQDNLNR